MNEEHTANSNQPPASQRRWLRVRYAIYAVVILAIVLGVIDYQRYHAQLDRAMAVVYQLEGRAGSILDWPFGREMVVTFERSLTSEELERLGILNSLQGRHVISVWFRCQMTPQQLAAAQAALPDLNVRQVDDQSPDG
ncbi:hypothetical protein Pan97_12120 [Bremerella volcania]|uniref:Uncharacterized protein n=1 Tax=Bremerella volcania TaxID=2527984 RepID=A0A518C4R4_9BACT|nr:hypothetical protein [Bremerella volcania]QDU74207.1 hypothetical protein Pan97_12120 [Bremerella volcania]